THHSDIVRQRLTRYAVRPVEAAIYRRAARVLSDSPGYMDGSPILQQHADKVDVLPLGIDLVPYREPSAAPLGHAARLRDQYGGPLWLSVGRLIYYKGLHIALAALRVVPGRLVVIGSGPLKSDLRARAAQLGVADRVEWSGRASADELIGAYH